MQALERAIGALAGINVAIGVVGRLIALSFLAIMLAIMGLAVFFRYVLNSSLTWSEDVVLMMAIWMTFAIAPLAYRMGANVALETLTARLRGRAACVLRLLTHLLILVLLGFLLYESWGFIERGFRIRANTVPVQMGWVYLMLPVSFAAMALAGLEHSLRAVAGLIRPDAKIAEAPGVHERLVVES